MKSANRVFFLLFITVLTFEITRGQIAGGLDETTPSGLGGNSYILGTVFWPNGTPVNVRMRIKLTTSRAGEIITTTDDRGQFVFSGVTPGSYSVVIDSEKEFLPVSQFVDVPSVRGNPRQSFTVFIRLVGRAGGTPQKSVISSNTLAGSKKAIQLFEKAKSLAQEQDHKGAIRELKLAIDEYPNFLDAYNELGVQYMQLGELENANNALTKALEIQKTALEPLLNHGITLFRLERLPEAEAEFRSALTQKPESSLAFYYLGRILTSQKKYNEAEDALNNALKFSKNEMVEAHRMLAKLFLAKMDSKRAISELEIYLKLVPDAPDKAALQKILTQLRTEPISK